MITKKCNLLFTHLCWKGEILMNQFQKLTKATPLELFIWMIGAGIAGFGIGTLIDDYVEAGLGIGILVIGILLHGWGMFRIYNQK